MNWITKTFRKMLGKPVKVTPITDDQLVESYVLHGSEFGSVVSMIYMGECVGFEELLTAWENAEAHYAELGYRTLTVDAFVSYGGWGHDIADLVRVPRDIGEEPVYHARYYREHFLGQCPPAIDFNKMAADGEIQSGNYAVPSTEHLLRK